MPSNQTFHWIRCTHQLDSPANQHEMCKSSNFVHSASLVTFTASLCPIGNIAKGTQRSRSSSYTLRNVVVERLGRANSALQHHRGHRQKWATVISNRCNHADHGTSIQLQTHLASLCLRTRMYHAVRSLHDFDSQVARVFLPRTGLHGYVSAVLSSSASCLASQFPTLLC